MCNNTNIHIKQDFFFSKSATLYFLFIFRREKKDQTNPIKHFNQSVSLAYFSEWNTKKNVYSVNKPWQREHSELTNVYFKKTTTPFRNVLLTCFQDSQFFLLIL